MGRQASATQRRAEDLAAFEGRRVRELHLPTPDAGRARP